MPALQWRHDHHQPGALLLLGEAGARHLRQYRRHQDIRGLLVMGWTAPHGIQVPEVVAVD